MNVLITALVSYIYLVGLKGKFSWFIITITLVKLSLYFLSFFLHLWKLYLYHLYQYVVFIEIISAFCYHFFCIYRNYICIIYIILLAPSGALIAIPTYY